MERKPNLNDDEGRIESEEYGPLPSLDYQFFEYMQEGVTVYTISRDESGKVVDLVINYANIAAYRQKKSLKKGLIGKSIKDICDYEAVAIDLEKANEAVSTGRGEKYEVHSASLDKYFSVSAFSPKEDLYITLATDITKQRKAEEEMQIERQKLLDIIEFLPDATFVINENKRVIAWNKAIEEMTGTPKEDILGKDEYAYSLPFYGEKRPILIDLIFLSEKEMEDKYAYVKREGKTLFAEVFIDNLFGGKGAYISVKASPLYDREGNLVGSIETVRDITELRKELCPK
jgi:PAS domain S-box